MIRNLKKFWKLNKETNAVLTLRYQNFLETNAVLTLRYQFFLDFYITFICI